MANNEFLTETQRSYLEDEHDSPNKNAEEQMRHHIRENTRQALVDLKLVANQIEQRDMSQISWQKEDPERHQARGTREYQPVGFLPGIVPSVISLLYRLRPDADLTEGPNVFEEYVEMGIEDAIGKEGWTGNVSVSIRVKRDPIDQVHDKLDSEGVEAVNDRELRALRDAGKIEWREYHELVVERHERRIDRIDEPSGWRMLRKADEDEETEAEHED